MTADLQAQLAEDLARYLYVHAETEGSHERRRAWDSSTIPESLKEARRRQARRLMASEVLAALVSAHVAQVREGLANAWQRGYDRGKSDHCDYWPTSDQCEIAAPPNPYIVRPSVGPREQGGGGA